MMMPVYYEEEEFSKLSRPERRRYIRQHQKIKKKLMKRAKHGKLDVIFDNETVTSSGTFVFIEAFKKAIQLQEMVKNHVIMERHPNADYPYEVLIDQLVDALLLGCFRYSHMNQLKQDPGYIKIKEWANVADESTIRKAFKNISKKQLQEFNKLNAELVTLLLSLLPCQVVWLNADDTVIVVFSNQENAKKGYNPKSPGRKSFKAKVTTIDGLDYIVNLGLYSGDTASNGSFHEHLKDTLSIMDGLKNIVLEGIRLDKGFFDQKTFHLLEELSLFYVCKAPMNSSIKKMIEYFNDEDWTPISENYDSAELTVALPTWEKARRFAFIRKKSMEYDKDNEIIVIKYRYEVIVTNIIEGTPEDIWHQYNKRADVENRIDELKQGVALDKTSQSSFKCNQFLTTMKTIAYNLLQGFKRLLPINMLPNEVPTIRRVFIQQPGNICRKGSNLIVRLAHNPFLEKVIIILKRKINILIERLSVLRAVKLHL